MKSFLQIEGLTKSFGDRVLFADVTFGIYEGDKIGLIAKNGMGKTTLLRIIAGEEAYDSGNLVFRNDLRVGYLPQLPEIDGNLSVIEACLLPDDPSTAAIKHYEEVVASGNMEALGKAMEAMDASGAWDYEGKIKQILSQLKITDLSQPVGQLSGGQLKRVALAKVIINEPELLILDEPTNHLDIDMIEWLEDYLRRSRISILMVTHDRYFLDHVAGWILELDRGEGIPWKGNYSSWLEQKTKRMEMEEKTASKRRKTLERELEWVRMAPKARQAKGKARLNSYDKLLNEDVKEKEEKLEIFIPNGPRLGNKVIEAKHVAKAYGDKLLFDDLNFMLPPNGIVGVIGPNGAGKTTLFRLIMGLEKVDKGEFEVGETVKVAYVDQQHKDIDPNKSVYQVISGGNDLIRMGGRDINARAYLSRFNFSGADQEKLCGVLSGGERNRLHLAMALKEEGNVLLLDEPTNDIDVNTLRALEEGLEDFAGCAVVISHDRWFLDRICTHILAFEGDSNVFYFEGSYSEYEENKLKRLGNEEPKRVRYRKLIAD